MFNAGDQFPVMPSNETFGKGAKILPLQMGVTGSNEGILSGLTVIVNVAFEAHCPLFGAKV